MTHAAPLEMASSPVVTSDQPAGTAGDPRSPSSPAIVWIVLGLGGIATVAAAIFAAAAPLPPWWLVAAAVAVFAVGDAAVLHIRFGHDQDSFTLSEAALIVGLAMVPVPWAALAGAVGVALAHSLARRSPIKIAFNAMSFIVATLLARVAYELVSATGTSLLTTAEALVAASAVFFLWNSTMAAWAVAASQRIRLWKVYSTGLLLCLFVWLGNTLVGVLLVALMKSNSILVAAVPLLLVLLCLMYWSYLRAMNERDVWRVLQNTSRELLHAKPNEVAEVILTFTPQLFSAEFVELILIDHNAADRAMVFRWRAPGMINVFDHQPIEDNPYWARAQGRREPFEVSATDATMRQRDELARSSLAKCYVAPLFTQERCLGMLRIGFRGQAVMTPRELQVLATFANHVSASVHNTRSFEAMRAQALRDPLTGLANRLVLVDRLQQAQARSVRTSRQLAVMFLDLDRFKLINDSLGHEAGDALLVAVSERILGCLRPSDTAARLGGDEFVVLAEDLAGASEAEAIADRIASALTTPFTIAGQQVYISASIGIAVAEHPHEEPDTLLRNADAAMYEAKSSGRARWQTFSSELRADALGRLQLENDLRMALARDELRLDYQPNVTLDGERIVGVEALLRWDHPIHGLIGPSTFISVAEETGLIVPIGAWVIETACGQLASWERMGAFGDITPYMSINLSPLQLAHPELVETIRSVLTDTGVDPANVCFEITEGALVRDLEGAREVLRELQDLGARTALDDFGTGYSSLSYLQMLPVDVLKLDMSLVARMTPDPRDGAVVGGMVDLAHALNLVVVAEGVETEEQMRNLRALRCDVAQGFHFYKPQSAATLEALLLRGAVVARAT